MQFNTLDLAKSHRLPYMLNNNFTVMKRKSLLYQIFYFFIFYFFIKFGF